MKKNILIIFLLILLISLVIVPNYVLPLFSLFVQFDYNPDVYQYFFVIVSYFCIILYVWLEQDNLTNSNFDRLSLLILVFFGFIRSETGIRGEIFYKLPINILSLLLLSVLIVLWKKIPKTKMSWLLIGGFLCFMVLPLAFIESLQKVMVLPQSEQGYLFDGIRRIIYNFSFIAPFEEIAIRGMLWGQLRKWGMNEKTVFWFQAGIFWTLHIWKIGTPITFFITIPIVTIVYSILVRYSKQLSPSIIVHAFINAILPVVIQFMHLD